MNSIFGAENTFETPKPERLIKRVLELSTDEGDIVLDSFVVRAPPLLLRRRWAKWIMVELGDHAQTHIVPRLKRSSTVKDQGGVTELQDGKAAAVMLLSPCPLC